MTDISDREIEDAARTFCQGHRSSELAFVMAVTWYRMNARGRIVELERQNAGLRTAMEEIARNELGAIPVATARQALAEFGGKDDP